MPHAPLEAGSAPPFHIDPARAPRLGFGVPFAGDLLPATTRFAASADGRLLYSCGYWDHSLKASQLADGRSAQSLRAHTDVVRYLCPCLSPCLCLCPCPCPCRCLARRQAAPSSAHCSVHCSSLARSGVQPSPLPPDS